MNEKITSIKVNPETWRKAKLLAVKRGVTLKSIVEDLLMGEIKADEVLGEVPELKVSSLMKALEQRRGAGQMPFVIISKKRAVDIVREHRSR
ncbi:MAG: hypothetical protein NZ941_03775 [Candidatus Caldarchaeum sp.]|nr:hypothetical protein [Candidatus Caldarchaeum sp.]MDW7977970.1 hypothetical protein [Candidatus Caldarchaeum sp.]